MNYDMALSLVDAFSDSEISLIDVMRHHFIVLAPYLIHNNFFYRSGAKWASFIDEYGNASFLFSSATGVGVNIDEAVNSVDPDSVLSDFSQTRGECDVVLNHSVEYANFLSRIELVADKELVCDWDLDTYFDNVLSTRTLQNSDNVNLKKVHPQVSFMSSTDLIFSFVNASNTQKMLINDSLMPSHPYFSAHMDENSLNGLLLSNLISLDLVDERYMNCHKSLVTYGFYEYHKGYIFNLDTLEDVKLKYMMDNPWLARRIYYVGDNMNGRFVFGKKDDYKLAEYASELITYLRSTATYDDIYKIFRYICNLTKYMILYSHYKCYIRLDSLREDFSKIVLMSPPIKKYIEEILRTIFDGYKGIANWNSYNDFKTTIVNGGEYRLTVPDFFDLVQERSADVDFLVQSKNVICGIEQDLYSHIDSNSVFIADNPDILPVIDIPVVDLDCYYQGESCNSKNTVSELQDTLMSIYSIGLINKNPGILEQNLMEDVDNSVFDNIKTKVFYYSDANLPYRASCLSVTKFKGKVLHIEDVPVYSYESVKFYDSDILILRKKGIFLLFKICDLNWARILYMSSLVYGLVRSDHLFSEKFYLEYNRTMETRFWFGDG